MTTTARVTYEPSPTARHFALAVLALSMGGFTIGTTEFVTMGLIREIASGVDVSIPNAGHLISAYAVGVVVGAPVLAYFGARWPRRALLVALLAAYGVFNALSAVAGSFGMLLVARFLDGLPHGAYFGVASLVAANLAPEGRKGRAVAMVMIGLSVANVVGVPGATWMGQHLGWRSAFWAVAGLSVLTVLMVLAFVPSCPGDPEATGRRELRAFTHLQVWLTLLAGAIGFGGMFAVFSYIAPTVTEVGGLGDGSVPLFLLFFGLGMVVGTFVAGELADWSILRSLLGSALGMSAILVAFWALAPHGYALLPVAFAVTFTGSVLVVNLQLRLMDVAGEAQTLGAAMNHASLNVANALGAWLGGVVIAAGHGYRAPALVGAGLSLAGFAVIALAAAHHVRGRTSQ
jgi:DHA1 family inner membrane transport protein